jgi:hypothetical protein
LFVILATTAQDHHDKQFSFACHWHCSKLRRT